MAAPAGPTNSISHCSIMASKMSKRNYDEISESGRDSDPPSKRVSRPHQDRLGAFLEQGKKALFRSLKVARGFERQKLGRRQKTAKAENAAADAARLDAEVAALKVGNEKVEDTTPC